MIKLIIVDLDGTLTSDTKTLHRKAFLKALETVCPQFLITEEEHLAKYCGLSTTAKLEKLTGERGLSKELYNEIWSAKQDATFPLLRDTKVYPHITECLDALSKKYKIVCCSNSIDKTVRLTLFYTGYMEYIDYYYGNDNVRPKPATDIYLKAILESKVNPDEVLIIEDSPRGIEGASKTGTHIMQVSGPEEVTLENVNKRINSIENKEIRPKWKGKINVVIPAAGLGSRFQQAGYTMPKPLIDVHRKPMICQVIDNLNIDGQYTFIVQKEHTEKYNLRQMLELVCPGCNVIEIDEVTEGAACTVLLAKEFIDNDTPLLIANSDQFVSSWDSNEFLYSSQQVDGSILCFESTHPKWSYAKTDDNGFLTELKEKQVISNNATVGIYYWNKGKYLVKSIEDMIEANDRFNNEFYLAPSYNYMIKNNMKVKISKVDAGDVWGLGTPEDLSYFISQNQ